MALSGAAMAYRPHQCRSNAVFRHIRKLSVISCSSSSTPGKVRKFSNRKNYLRLKLLKTLTKPYSNWYISELPREISGDLLDESSSPDEYCRSFPEQCSAGSGNEESVEELGIQEFRVSEVSESVGVMDSNVTEFSKDSIFKFGLWLLCAFMFQTICAVLVLGSDDISQENGDGSKEKDKDEILDGLNGKDNSKLNLLGLGDERLVGGGAFNLNEEDVEKKIDEIQLMAREARDKERLGMEKNEFQNDDSDDEDEEAEEDFGWSKIEKEVKDRLVKLSKKLENVEEKMSVSFTNNMKRDGGRSDKVEKGVLKEDNNVALMFKKKYKFRSSLSGNTYKPKGSMNSGNLSTPKEAREDGRNRVGDISSGDLVKDGNKKQSVEESKFLRSSGKELAGRDIKKPGQKLELAESELNGLKKGRKGGSFETVKPSEANVLESPPAIYGEQNILDQKNSSRGTGNLLSAESEPKTSEVENDFWWFGLPYVLVIFMCRGLDDEVTQGPFCLKSGPGSNSKYSHTVAFEDRGDASNFCYILQTFFSDLEDFSAEIVPLSIKELKKAVESKIITVMVVKKGQLKLYAGQPLPEAEMALRSILE